MTIHQLKTDPDIFDAVEAGLKTFEVRKDDRGFQVNDTLELLQTKYSAAQMTQGLPLEYTGKTASRVVTYILRGPAYGVPEGFAILSMR